MVGDRVGEKFINKRGQKCTVIEDFGYNDLTIIFEDGSIRSGLQLSNLKIGAFKNFNLREIYGFGCIGNGDYCRNTFSYTPWMNMLMRCYSKSYQIKNPSYKEVSISEEWSNFQNFAKWWEENYIEEFQLDKDILQKGNKTYSPETCCFVPKEVNSLFTNRQRDRGKCLIGVREHYKKVEARVNKNGKSISLGTYNTPEEAFQAYKIAKEEYIREVADKWKGKVTEECYQAMISYQVEITD